jgi:hypothetical protein
MFDSTWNRSNEMLRDESFFSTLFFFFFDHRQTSHLYKQIISRFQFNLW